MGVVLFSQAQEHTAGNLWFKWVAKKQAKLGVSQGLVSWLFIFYNGSQFGISHTYKITMGYKTRSHGWSKGMVALKVSWSAVSLYFNGFQLSRTNKWVLYSSKQVVETGINWLAEEN